MPILFIILLAFAGCPKNATHSSDLYDNSHAIKNIVDGSTQLKTNFADNGCILTEFLLFPFLLPFKLISSFVMLPVFILPAFLISAIMREALKSKNHDKFKDLEELHSCLGSRFTKGSKKTLTKKCDKLDVLQKSYQKNRAINPEQLVQHIKEMDESLSKIEEGTLSLEDKKNHLKSVQDLLNDSLWVQGKQDFEIDWLGSQARVAILNRLLIAQN